jgi:choline dehydrogenase-like flavoprotein
VIGSGPGGALAALPLVRAGARVLMLERGDWVIRGPAAREPGAAAMLSPSYSMAAGYDASTDVGRRMTGAFHCVGGPTVFYAGVSMRFREADFQPAADILAGSGASWPFDYAELEPYYASAESILGVSGDAGADPTEPPRRAGYAVQSPPLTVTGTALHAAARGLGLHPFRPPLAINHVAAARAACEGCGACDGFACATDAKGDASTVVRAMIADGLELRVRTAAVRLAADRGRITAVECVDLATGRRYSVRADTVILAAGALATPHLLLASNLVSGNPGAQVVGRYLTRHCNGVVVAFFPRPPGGGFVPFKEFAVNDFYFGHPDEPAMTRVGIIQQTALPASLVLHEAPRLLRPATRAVLPHLMGLIVIGEDQPVFDNHVALDGQRRDALGLPGLNIHHRHTPRDLLARRLLLREARRILSAAGSVGSIWRSIDTFSHALGTVRMGDDVHSSALDADGRYRGFANLYVADGSALPTSAAVNPSLTIAATALRVGARLARSSYTAQRADRSIPLEVSYPRT